MKRTIHLWNKSIYDDCYESVKSKLPDWNGENLETVDMSSLSVKDRAYVDRNYKVLKDIDKANTQVVNADCRLMATLLLDDMDTLPIKYVELSFNDLGYTQYKEKPGSSIKLFVVDKTSSEETDFCRKQEDIFSKYISPSRV